MVATTAETPRFFGRRRLMSVVEEVTAENVVDVLRSVKLDMDANAVEIEYLYNYYKGNQPILGRTKQVRPEINNKVVENHAYEIVSFKNGYIFGEPVQYVRRNEDESISEALDRLNEIMLSESKHAQDRMLGEWMHIAGTGYRMCQPTKDDNKPFEIDVCDPRFTFVVYNTGFKNRPIMGGTKIKTLEDKVRYNIYTPTRYFEIEDDLKVKDEPNVLGAIPVFEYPANMMRLGAFEVTMGLLDTLNRTVSNRMDGVEQHIQSFLAFINCDIDDPTFTALKEEGALTVKGEMGLPAEIKLLVAALDQTDTQILKDDIYQSILTICGIPNRHGATRSTSDTGQAVSLRDGWEDAEARAKETELMFKLSERQFLALALKIMGDVAHLPLNLEDIDIEISRDKSANILTKTQGMQNQQEFGIDPEIIIAQSGLYADPADVYQRSKPYIEKRLAAMNSTNKVTPANNKPNPEGGGS